MEQNKIKIFISNKLRKLLENIKDQSIVAKMLLEEYHDANCLADDYVNYISISRDDHSKISYVSSDRIATIKESDIWTSPRRYQAKPGAFVSKLFLKMPNREIENFSNLYKSEILKPNFSFKVIQGEDIRYYYNADSYLKNSGSLGSSCMKYEESGRYLDIYVENPDIVSMLVMLDEYENLMGRALLWNLPNHKIMDRIYTINDDLLRNFFKKWANEFDYFSKKEQNWGNTLFFEKSGKKEQLKLEIKIPYSYNYYPYLDTFKFIDIDNNVLYNYIPDGFLNIRTLISTNGSLSGGNELKFDSISETFIKSCEAIWLDGMGIYTHIDNTVWSNYNDKYLLNSKSIYLSDIDDWVLIGQESKIYESISAESEFS
jgi:hypothetical protein